MGWWLGLAPATLEFWVRFPNERNQGKQAHPVFKYWVPHGSQVFATVELPLWRGAGGVGVLAALGTACPLLYRYRLTHSLAHYSPFYYTYIYSGKR